MRTGGNHIGLPLHNGVFVGADLCVCPDSHVEIILRRHLPSARAEFMIAPLRRFPPLREGNRAGVRFPPLREGNRNGVQFPLLCEGNHNGVRFPLLREGNRNGVQFTLLREGNLKEGVINCCFL